MKIAVMGAGAVGCYYGGMLARAGHDVTLVGRGGHVEVIRHQGMRLQAHGFDEQVRLAASTEASAVAGARLILLCVKSTDTESAAEQMRPFLDADATLFTFQNGVDNADRLKALLPQEVAAAVVYVASEMAGPGFVRHQGRGEIVLEPSGISSEAARWFIEAGVPAEVSDNVRGALWFKLLLNCAYNALSAITQMPYGVLVHGQGVHDLLDDVVAEVLAVAAAEGVRIPGDPAAAVRLIPETMPAQRSSTAQDLARGKRSEIDYLNGYIVRKGRELAIPVPANRVLHTLVKLIEERGVVAAAANAGP